MQYSTGKCIICTRLDALEEEIKKIEKPRKFLRIGRSRRLYYG